MPLHQEKKYRIDSFANIEALLTKMGAEPERQSESTHYYVPRDDNNVVKLVAGSTGFEIHELTETDGKFELTGFRPMGTLAEGLASLEARGCDTVFVVHMQHTDYRYKDGLIGLYTINHGLLSVILDFPEGQHAEVARSLSLDDAEVLLQPYNKYLEQNGLLKPINIDEVGGPGGA